MRERAAAAGIRALGSAHFFVLLLVLSLKRLRIEDALRPVGALWAST